MSRQSNRPRRTPARQQSRTRLTLLAISLLLIVTSSALRSRDYALAGSHSSAQPAQGSGALLRTAHDCLTTEQRAEIDRRIAKYKARGDVFKLSPQAEPQSYPFHPQGGSLWQDLYITNFVDLDPSSGIRDWDCSAYTYDGHRGIDALIRSFREQMIGVPVFAALDGRVIDTHDGEPDMNTQQMNVPANYVVLDHGSGHITLYLHFKRNSVAVNPGQDIKAGTQIGLTGSSGFSDAPHLHFESQLNGVPYEPFAGRCRSGQSNWAEQTPIRREAYSTDFCFSNGPFTSYPFHFDDAPRLGAYMVGQQTIFFRLLLGNLPEGSSYSFIFRRPDGSVAFGEQNAIGFSTQFFRLAWIWWGRGINLNVLGIWKLELSINGQKLVDAPFDVVASGAAITNRAPNPINIRFTPQSPSTEDVIFCRVQTSLVSEDPDYDIVSYRYEWKLNGSVIRQITSAALADTIPRGLVKTGDILTCTVTPSDGTADGLQASLSVIIGEAFDTLNPSVSVVAPAGGKLKGNREFTAAWNSSDNIEVTSHDVLLSTDGGESFPTVLAAGLPGSQKSLTFIVPNVKGKKSYIKVIATDAAGNRGEAVSAKFKIKRT